MFNYTSEPEPVGQGSACLIRRDGCGRSRLAKVLVSWPFLAEMAGKERGPYSRPKGLGMRGVALACMLLVALTGAVRAVQARSCVLEVLYSEELPIGPLFYHTVRADLLVIPPKGQPFETTVWKVIPWQVPPPRRGQRVRRPCGSVASELSSIF